MKHNNNPAKENIKNYFETITINNEQLINELYLKTIDQTLEETAEDITNDILDIVERDNPSTVKQVEEFHRVFGHLINKIPTVPDVKVMDARTSFIQEELMELQTAIDEGDIVGIADALVDIQYFLDGAFLEYGLHHLKDKLFAEVQRSNMSKACKTQDEAIQTSIARARVHGECYIEQVGDKFVVYRSRDRKIMKSINYSEPNLKPIINDTTN